jgi:short-subunit dehydrogenase
MLDANRGHIVLISSILGLHASHGPISYISSKHASVGLSRSLRLDIHATHPNSRVSVHCICPYLMRTKMFNPMVNRVSLKLLLPIVSPRYAANQVLDAIEWNRNEVILPYHLKYIGLINDFLLPKWFSEWLLFHVSGRQPLDAFNKDNEEIIRERKRKHLHTAHKENIDLI